jgi:hypothetical protein
MRLFSERNIEGGQAMSLTNDVGSEIKAAKKLRLPWGQT